MKICFAFSQNKALWNLPKLNLSVGQLCQGRCSSRLPLGQAREVQLALEFYP